MQVVENRFYRNVFFFLFLQISQLVHMGQTEQFCLGMKRLEFQTIFAKSVLFFNTSPFSKRKLLMSAMQRGGAFDFSERGGCWII